MTTDEDRLLLSAFVTEARTAYALFESLPTWELLGLQAAHQIDLAQATAPESVAFSGGRLALIAAVLKARGVTP
jgi:hypothetical protein